MPVRTGGVGVTAAAPDETNAAAALSRADAASRRAFLDTAQENATSPTHCRIALAVHGAGPDGLTTQELEDHLLIEGSTVRRALGDLYEAEFAIGRGVDGGRRRQGVVTQVTLTDRGRVLAREILARQQAAHTRSHAYREAVVVHGRREHDEPDQIDRKLDDTGFSAGTV